MTERAETELRVWRRGLRLLPSYLLTPPHPASSAECRVPRGLPAPQPAHISASTHRGSPPEWIPRLQHHQVKALDDSNKVTRNEQVQQRDDNVAGLGRRGAGSRELPSGDMALKEVVGVLDRLAEQRSLPTF